MKGAVTAAGPGGQWHPAGSRCGGEGVASGERPERGCRSPGPAAGGKDLGATDSPRAAVRYLPEKEGMGGGGPDCSGAVSCRLGYLVALKIWRNSAAIRKLRVNSPG